MLTLKTDIKNGKDLGMIIIKFMHDSGALYLKADFKLN